MRKRLAVFRYSFKYCKTVRWNDMSAKIPSTQISLAPGHLLRDKEATFRSMASLSRFSMMANSMH